MRGCRPHAGLEDLRSPVSTRAATSEFRESGAAACSIAPTQPEICGQPIARGVRGASAVSAQLQRTQLLLPASCSQATRELRARRVSEGAARVSAALRQRPSLRGRRGAAWQRSSRQRNRGQWQFATAETHLFCCGSWPAVFAANRRVPRQMYYLPLRRISRGCTSTYTLNNAWGDTPTKGREGQGKRNATEQNETKRNETKQNKKRNETKRKAQKAKKRNKRKRKAKWNTTGSEKEEQKEEKGEMEQNKEQKTGTKGRERRNGTKQIA